VVFDFARAGTLRAFLLAATALTLPLAASAQAEQAHITNCVWTPSPYWGNGGANNCVERWGESADPYIRTVPQPATDAEKARATERDQKWLQRCRPIIAQDRYGVPRYHYAAPGCDFGVIE
jgi:hypothetical protein